MRAGLIAPPSLTLDHLVVAARTLEEGVVWCEATFGVVPGAGGQHAAMGTHNRVVSIASEAFPQAYLEIIAIDPAAPAPAGARWFDLDAAAVQRTLEAGPQLVHWAARCAGIDAACAVMASAGADCGAPRAAERQSPAGLLQWKISIHREGRRALCGAAPTLIEWSGPHPTEAMPASGVTLESVAVGDWPDDAMGMLPPSVSLDLDGDPAADTGPAPLVAVLVGPRGRVRLASAWPEL